MERNHLTSFFRKATGVVMMEYVVISSVVVLGVAGVLHYDGRWYRLFKGALPGTALSPFTIDSDSMSYTVPTEAVETDNYGKIGDAYAERSQLALRLIASPLP